MTKTDRLTADAVRQAVMAYPSRYRTEDGREFIGEPCSGVAGVLRDAGWRGVGQLDEYDLRALGLEVVTARYVSGARPARPCRVVVVEER